ncbi:hypothetical protein DFH06DRAFT_1477223 [Mycena polygramma]|nr:hypothetical protein DFH06DRAFT_1477223 [Mycena polygramma]
MDSFAPINLLALASSDAGVESHPSTATPETRARFASSHRLPLLLPCHHYHIYPHPHPSPTVSFPAVPLMPPTPATYRFHPIYPFVALQADSRYHYALPHT